MVRGSYGICAVGSRIHTWVVRKSGLIYLPRANKMDSTVPWVLAAISFPVMFGKQIINVVQLKKASTWLAEGDVKARKAARDAKKH
jgi:CDP-diacylglycerol--inositol 3-phosphatidyltransferase